MARRWALKFLRADNTGPFSTFEWPPPNGKPGKWVKATGKLVVCENGIHACTPAQAPRWFNVNAYLIELDGKIIDHDDKLCARKGRLIRRLEWAPHLFAADCAEHVLHIFEDAYPDDDRPRKAIEAACSSTAAAAYDAYDDAAAAAAYAAYAGADAAYAAYADADAAYADAAYAAAAAAYAAAAPGAADAAYGAVSAAAAAAAADDAERKWQIALLLDHLHLTDSERAALTETQEQGR